MSLPPLSRTHKIVYALLIAIIAMLGVTAYVCYQKFEDVKEHPQQYVQQSSDDVVAKVARLLVLPTDETPTIATVTDLAKLKYLPFFKDAQVGDKVLMYAKARKAILYSPQENVVREVAPIFIESDLKALDATTNL